MNKDYQTIITKVSQQIAKTFLQHEENLAARATLVDTDISEITRQIGLETTKIIFEHVRNDLVKKTTRRFCHPKSSSHLLQSHVRAKRTQVSICMEALCWLKTPDQRDEHQASWEERSRHSRLDGFWQ